MHDKSSTIKMGFPQSLIDKEADMNEHIEKMVIKDNGGRRSGVDRRQFSYTSYIPERRSGVERRCGEDRRKITRLSSDLK